MLRVSQFEDVKNQFLVETDEGTMFQSYGSVIAFKDRQGTVHLSEHWDYSRTTGKYRNRFLGESINETRQNIKLGLYKLDIDTNGNFIKD
jgi:hypothetical protein